MNSHPNAEFAQFRFVRDGEGNPLILPSQGIDERNLLVIDYERWGLARLHIFEEAAVRKDKLEAFQDELARISDLRSKTLSRLVTWGRDGEELFYSDEMLDGEPMPDYLGRTGGVPFAVAGEWMMQIVKLLDTVPDDLPSFQRFSTLNFQIIIDSKNEVRPVFSEFFGWTKPGAQVREHTREWHLAQIFCSLVAGVPVRTFHDSSLPRNFDDLDDSVQSAVLDALRDGHPGAYDTFVGEMKRLAKKASHVRDETALPDLVVREWLRTELADSYPGDADYVLPEEYSRDEELYGLEASIRGSDSIVQLMPGPDYVPREGWLNQHHLATRRVGKAMLHQLHVNYIEDRDSVTLIGEERLSGVDLGSLIRVVGKQKPEVVAAIGERLGQTLTSLEGKVGSCAVWWLPPENILFRTGTRSLEGSARLIERKGAKVWDDLPIKLRLHQTTKTLRKGVSLPIAVRRLSKDPGKSNAEVRRQAVALPVIFFLLTAERFRWRLPVAKQARLPRQIGRLLEEARLSLIDDPELVEGDLFAEFASLVAEMSEKQEEVAEPAGEEKADEANQTKDAESEKSGPVELEPGSHEVEFRAAIEGMLYSGTIDLNDAEGTPKPPPEDRPDTPVEEEQDETAENLESEEEAEEITGKVKRPKWKFWSSSNLWLGFFAIVLALITGFVLSGWNAEQGPVQIDQQPAFAAVALPHASPIDQEKVIQKMESYLIEAARPDLVPALREWQGDVRDAVEGFLEEKTKDYQPDSAGLLAALSMIEGKNDADERILRAAVLGDLSSQVQVADRVLVKGEEVVDRDQARKFLESAAARKDPEASLLLASLQFQEGEIETAPRTIGPAVEKNLPAAWYQLGLMHGHSDVKEEAARCLEKAAEMGEPRAMVEWAKCLEAGYGIEASFTEASRWMKLAAAADQPEAKNWCAARGIEVELASKR